MSATEFQYQHNNNASYDVMTMTEIEYVTDENRLDTDSRIQTCNYCIGHGDVVQTVNGYDGKKRIVEKTTPPYATSTKRR